MNQGFFHRHLVSIAWFALLLVAFGGCAHQPKPDADVKAIVDDQKPQAKESEDQESESFGCPRPVILRDLSRQVMVADYSRPFTPDEVIARIELERVAHANCDVKVKNRRGFLEGVVRISATKGPHFPENEKSIQATYFIVARKPTGEVVGKSEKEIILKFDSENDTYVGKVDLIELDAIEVGTDEEFDALKFFVGLQFSPESWAFQQKFGAQIFGSQL